MRPRDVIVWTLFLLFLGLKLAREIAWSWVWVFAPLWIPLAVAALMLVLGQSLIHLSFVIDKRGYRTAKKAYRTERELKKAIRDYAQSLGLRR